MTKVAKRFFITGRVQGVGFRYWAVGRAKQHGLLGWVRNLRDSRVEILAYGENAALSRLEQELADGPPGALVQGVEPAPVTPEEAELAATATRFEQKPTA